MSESPFESAEADAAEQQAEVVPDDEEVVPEDEQSPAGSGSDEVEPADRAEQERVVGTADEDDYR